MSDVDEMHRVADEIERAARATIEEARRLDADERERIVDLVSPIEHAADELRDEINRIPDLGLLAQLGADFGELRAILEDALGSEHVDDSIEEYRARRLFEDVSEALTALGALG